MYRICDTNILKVLQKLFQMLKISKHTRKEVQGDQKKKVDIAVRNARLLSDYLELGFKSLSTLREIMKAYYPDLSDLQIRRVWDIRSRENDVLDKFEQIINILKNG